MNSEDEDIPLPSPVSDRDKMSLQGSNLIERML
jgi:hypothetical protein